MEYGAENIDPEIMGGTPVLQEHGFPFKHFSIISKEEIHLKSFSMTFHL